MTTLPLGHNQYMTTELLYLCNACLREIDAKVIDTRDATVALGWASSSIRYPKVSGLASKTS